MCFPVCLIHSDTIKVVGKEAVPSHCGSIFAKVVTTTTAMTTTTTTIDTFGKFMCSVTDYHFNSCCIIAYVDELPLFRYSLMFTDDYFLSNVKTVDDVTEERKRRLLGVAQWKAGLQTSVGTWPCFNVITDLPADEKQEKLCAACDKSQVSVRVQMYGQPYNSTTLEGCQPDPKVANQKVSKFVAVVYCGLCFKTF